MSFADIQQNDLVLTSEQKKRIKGGNNHTSTANHYIGGTDIDAF